MPAFIALAALFGSAVMGLSAGAAIVLGGRPRADRPRARGRHRRRAARRRGEEHEPHFGVSAEAGFNDGLAFPFVLLGIAIAADGLAGVVVRLADVVYAIAGGRGARRRARLRHRGARSCACATASC